MRYFFTIICLWVFAFSTNAKADNLGCIRNNCMGTCISKEEALHKAIPMICRAEYACYRDIDCVKKDDGNCGWEETEQFKACLVQKKKDATSPLPSPLR